jgi:hypothetical protein
MKDDDMIGIMYVCKMGNNSYDWHKEKSTCCRYIEFILDVA